MSHPLQDTFGRKITYLRLSVTDRCDFRCSYCMAERMEFVPRDEILSLEECLLVARAFVSLGVSKIRLTGGEPLVRKDIDWLAGRLSDLEGLRELVLTTNGSQLPAQAAALARAGVGRVNISLDSLVPETFRRITRTGELGKVLAGIDAGIAAWGPRNIKLNVVPMRGINDHELPVLAQFALDRGIDVSFIEQMPLGDTVTAHEDSCVSNEEVLARLKAAFDLLPSAETSGGPARYWRLPGHESRIGLISPHSRNFCADCNRMRVTARGELFPCLGNANMVDLLPAARAGDEARLRELILEAVAVKPEAHTFDMSGQGSSIVRFMSRTGG
jgi:cyclic pyranopterin phosphate synthase